MTSTPEQAQSIPPDAVLSAVANDHRRAVLRSLNQTDGKVMEFGALVDQVTEHVRDGEPPDDEHRQRVRIELHHIHLPKLEDCGMIVHDTETMQIRNVTGTSPELGKELLALIAPYEARD